MRIVGCHKVQRSILSSYRNLKNAIRTSTKNSCEDEDCCGNIIEKCEPNIVIERTCHPCSFYTWKPKLPNLLCPPEPKPVPKPRKRQKCYAGMVTPKPKTIMQIKKEAEQCFKECGPKPICPPQPKKPAHAPYEKYSPPLADWDHDGYME